MVKNNHRLSSGQVRTDCPVRVGQLERYPVSGPVRHWETTSVVRDTFLSAWMI